VNTFENILGTMKSFDSNRWINENFFIMMTSDQFEKKMMTKTVVAKL
jgi:hypothetical protein